MFLKLVCVGQKMPDWIQAGFDDYAKRLSGGQCRLQLKELAPAKRSKQGIVSRYLEEESEKIHANLQGQPIIVVLDERGDLINTKQLSQKLSQWLPSGQDVVFVVGGPDGLHDSVKSKADWMWSLSPLTLPHPMVRVLLAEQLYRAWSLLNHHPYHRE